MLAPLMTFLAGTCLNAPIGETALNMHGQARYKKALFKLYDASLCSQNSEFKDDAPFALSLDYLRSFSSEQITKAAIHEMARFSGKEQSEFDDFRPTLLACFPDVKKGDQILSISTSATTAEFHYNGKPHCEMEHPDLREHFFGIWLSEDAMMPRKARVLKGLEE
ncbi:MAG: chalcone isomerase family protein [Maricaulaceae bacterium]